MAITFRLVIILFFLFCLNYYFIFKNKWNVVFKIALLLLLMVPPEIIGLFSGVPYNQPGYLNLSLIGYDVIIICIISLLKYKKIDKNKNVLNIIMLILLFVVVRLFVNNLGFLSNKLFDNYILPFFLGLLVINHLDKSQINEILNFALKLIFINAIVACIEFVYGQSLLFHDYYLNHVSWYSNVYESTRYDVSFRSTAFLGHPLFNGIYYIVALIILMNSIKEKSSIIKYIQLIIIVLAIYSTNSRIALLMALLYYVYFLIREKKVAHLIILFCCLIAIFASLDKLNILNIYYSVFSRDVDGTSIIARIDNLFALKNISAFDFLFGVGFNQTSTILRKYNLIGNFEVSYIIILLENGLICFLYWIHTLMGFYTKKMDLKYKKIINEILVCFLIMCGTSNSIGDPGTLNYILLIIIGLSTVAKSIEKEKEINLC